MCGVCGHGRTHRLEFCHAAEPSASFLHKLPDLHRQVTPSPTYSCRRTFTCQTLAACTRIQGTQQAWRDSCRSERQASGRLCVCAFLVLFMDKPLVTYSLITSRLLTCLLTCVSCLQDPFEELETYHDNAIDRFFINYFGSKMSKQLGGTLQQ